MPEFTAFPIPRRIVDVNALQEAADTAVAAAAQAAPVAGIVDEITTLAAISTDVTTVAGLVSQFPEVIAGAELAQAWAESETAPDPEDPTSKSAKVWADVSEGFAAQAGAPYPTRAAFLAATIPPVVTRTSFFVGDQTYAVVRDAAGPIEQADGTRWAPDGAMSLPHFGAVGDGVSDDTAAVAAALSYASSVSGFLSGKSLRYRLTGKIVFPSNVKLFNVEFDATEVVGGGGSRQSLFTADGSVTAEFPLTANAASSDGPNPFVEVAPEDAAIFAGGDLFIIKSNEIWNSETSSSVFVGEMGKVRYVDAGRIYIQKPLSYNYTTANTGRIQKVTPAKDIILNKVKAIGPQFGLQSEITPKLGFFSALYSENIKVDNIDLDGFNRSGIETRWGYNTWVERSRFHNFVEYYGVSIFNGSTNFWLDRCEFLNTRHAMSVGSSNVFDGGIARNLWITNNISNGRDASFDAHEPCDGMVFTGNVMTGGGEESSAIGVTYQGKSFTCNNNQFFGYCRTAIYYNPIYNAPYRGASTINGNSIQSPNTDSSSTGIFVLLGFAGDATIPETLSICNNSIAGNFVTGISVISTSTVADIENVTVNGNPIKGAATAISIRSNSDRNIRNCAVVGNALDGFTIGVQINAASASALVQGITVASNAMANGVNGFVLTGSASFSDIMFVPGSSINVTTPVQSTLYRRTISSGTVLRSVSGFPVLEVDTEASASADDLDTVTGGRFGDIMTLKAVNGGRVVTVKRSGLANGFRLNGSADYVLDNTFKTLTVMYDGTRWVEVSRGAGA